MGREIVKTTDGRTWQVRYQRARGPRVRGCRGFRTRVGRGRRLLFASTDGGVQWAVSSRTTGVTASTSPMRFTAGRSPTLPCCEPTTAVPIVAPVHDALLPSTEPALPARTAGSRAWELCTRRTTTARHWSTPTHRYATLTASVVSPVICSARRADRRGCSSRADGAAAQFSYIGYRCSDGKCVAVVKQNYFPPSITGIDGPGSYPGPFSVIDDHTAVFVGNTPPAEQPMTMLLVTDDGRGHVPRSRCPTEPRGGRHALGQLHESRRRMDSRHGRIKAFHILATANGGRTWRQQYRAPQS